MEPKQLLDLVFQAAQQSKASDIHLVVGQPPILRIDGSLREIEGIKVLEETDTQQISSTILVKPQWERFYQDKELDTAYQTPDGSRYRINFHWATGHIAVAIRVLAAQIPTMDEVGMPRVTWDFLKEDAGLILVVGPTGSGKTTALAAMVNQVNHDYGKHIITLEDPIEYLYQSDRSIVKQREYGSDFLSFPEGLKRALRQDPDVLMVGEMRDLETMALAISSAETGHLVFATLHTYSGAQTIDRIVDSFPPHQQSQIRLQLSFTLRGIISQRLLPKIGGGRVAAREILVSTNAIANSIRENKIERIQTAIDTGADVGMIPMDRALKDLVDKGIVEKEHAMVYATNGLEY